MMKLDILFGILLVTSFAAADFCYTSIESACSSIPGANANSLLSDCNAKYGSIDVLIPDLQAYANAQIGVSFEYLIMSSHFANFETNRAGFAELYRKLSDKAWENGIDIIKFITKRGGTMNFNQPSHLKRNTKEHHMDLNELQSLAKALDFEKQLAAEALRIYTKSQHYAKQDGSVTHYLEEKFLESQAESVRNLAGNINDLKSLLTDHDASVSVFLFDEYLKSLF